MPSGKKQSRTTGRSPTGLKSPAAMRAERRNESRPRRTTAEIAADLERVDAITVSYDKAARAPERRAVAYHYLVNFVLPKLGLEKRKVSELDEGQLMEVFIEMYREFGNVGAARRVLGIKRSLIAVWRRDAWFKERMDEAFQDSVDDLETEAWRRAVDGTIEQTVVTEDGVPVRSTVVRRYSDGLLQFMMKGQRPEKYRDRVEHSTPTGQPMEITTETKSDVVKDILSMIQNKPNPSSGKPKRESKK